MADFTISDARRLDAEEGTVALAFGGVRVGGRSGGFAAMVTTDIDGAEVRLGVSQLDGETEWIVDSFSVNGVPRFVNGVAARCTTLKAVTDAEIVAALDAAAGAVAA